MQQRRSRLNPSAPSWNPSRRYPPPNNLLNQFSNSRNESNFEQNFQTSHQVTAIYQSSSGFGESGRSFSPRNRNPLNIRPTSNFRRSTTIELSSEDMESQRGLLIDQLTQETYDCMICYNVIWSIAPIWSCSKCFNLFHLHCIEKWAFAKNSSEENSSYWRCPSCQTEILEKPGVYKCFCGRKRNPDYNRFDIPHSCGDICHAQRGGECNHLCNIPCHPGPHPKCTAQVTVSCFCGDKSVRVQCYKRTEVRCEKVCNRPLNCGNLEHLCEQICHKSPCSSCSNELTMSCFCGKISKVVICGSSEGLSGFSCNQPCDKLLSCKLHNCSKPCHSGNCDLCPTDVRLVSTCSCGKCTLVSLKVVRTRCSDPIPSCGKVCDKLLRCGPEKERHRCEEKCHEGSCPPCDKKTSITCRCRKETLTAECTKILDYRSGDTEFLCKRRCNKKLPCGRHKCSESCCIALHQHCPKICGKQLSCGNHHCPNYCHSHPCLPCSEVRNDESISCYCGSQRLSPPIPCGAVHPQCENICTRLHECDHPIDHKCHMEEKCPPCPVLIERMCVGGHELRYNVPCYVKDVSCGKLCSKPLPCCDHCCQRSCHAGECINAEFTCNQPCTTQRALCTHACNAPCHKGNPCPETACQSMVEVYCACKNLRQLVPCYVEMGKKKLTAGSSASGEYSSLSSDLPSLPCDQTCEDIENRRLAAERTRKFAEALNIGTDSHVVNTDSYNSSFGSLPTNIIKNIESVMDMFEMNEGFAREVENVLRNLVENCQSTMKNTGHSFAPMRQEKRKFVHEMAEIYECVSESYDRPPYTNVSVRAVFGKSMIPPHRLDDMARIYRSSKSQIHSLRMVLNDDSLKDGSSKHQFQTLKSATNYSTQSRRIPPIPVKAVQVPIQNQFNTLLSLDSSNEGYTSISSTPSVSKHEEKKQIDYFEDSS